MKKKLTRLGASRGIILDKQLLELAHIKDWVEIIVDQDLIVIRATESPKYVYTNGKDVA